MKAQVASSRCFPSEEEEEGCQALDQHRKTQQIREAEAPTVYVPSFAAPMVAYVPPPAPPVIEPAAREASGKFISVTGKIISFYFNRSLP